MTQVTVTYLQQLNPAEVNSSSKSLPEDARIELAEEITPEFSRFLYQSVGSELNWADRLDSTREQWDEVLRRPGSETWVLYQQGAPKGYVELVTEVVEAGSEVEIFYFGLFPEATGRGLGGVLLSEALRQAWTLGSRWTQLPAVSRVWLHTCSLDGPAALPNYQARGLKVYRTEVEETDVKDASTGLWPAAAR
ncbi:GNAT family N-acetyltransferase [Glutamicibacter sp. HZAU]|uniref:GNAT family N-acetyltransferase n=1 Tax=Glutamicibacter sp. HZAU TaxID=2049891 RepID=UPI000FFBBAD9|nr:GNAT family N-acetyltransferase [Glutamicibacter sp. HZAU]MDV2981390.1 GNAT family N-acetyltransferase [Actinomycetes bacterium ARC8]RWZ82504.1 GNAT family N-acetyltransferase [Glutamicibacter sp. HZAU]